MSAPKVFIIILNYNGKDTINACLSSVLGSDYPNFEVVVVDNASDDGSFEEAKKQLFKHHVIKNPENFGFAKGNNIGIRFALEKFADYVLILNNDTVIEAKTISLLVTAMEKNPKIGAASPLIFSLDGDIWFAGGKICWNRMKAVHLKRPIAKTPHETGYLSGCSLFVRKEVFKKIGLFDERYFLYYEDADFSMRAKKAGFSLGIIPEASIKHLEQSNSKNDSKTYWLVFSGLLFFYTHARFLKRAWMLLFYLPLRKLKNLYDISFEKSRTSKEVRRAYEDFSKAWNKISG